MLAVQRAFLGLMVVCLSLSLYSCDRDHQRSGDDQKIESLSSNSENGVSQNSESDIPEEITEEEIALKEEELKKEIQKANEDPKLSLKLHSGQVLRFNVIRETERSGRFEGREETEIDYMLKVEEDASKDEIQLEVVYERIRFLRKSRTTLAIDTSDPQENEAVILSSLRDVIDKKILVSVNRAALVKKIKNFPKPKMTLSSRLPGEEGKLITPNKELPKSKSKRYQPRGVGQDPRIDQIAATFLSFVVSESALTSDLQLMLGAGVQGTELRGEKKLQLIDSGASSSKVKRRDAHPGPVEVSSNGKSSTGSSPVSQAFYGGGKKGRGGVSLKYTGAKEAIGRAVYHFNLFQEFKGIPESTNEQPKIVGNAGYRISDGILESLNYLYISDLETSKGYFEYMWRVRVQRGNES